MASLTETLAAIIEARPTGPVLVLEKDADGGEIVCDLATFTKMIGTTALTHAALSALPIAKAGWQTYFDAWQAQGVIS